MFNRSCRPPVWVDTGSMSYRRRNQSSSFLSPLSLDIFSVQKFIVKNQHNMIDSMLACRERETDDLKPFTLKIVQLRDV